MRAANATLFTRFSRGTDGQDLVEYALPAGTIEIGSVTALQTVQSAINTHFNNVATTLGS